MRIPSPIVIVVVSLSVVLFGCAKKAPQTTVTPPPLTESESTVPTNTPAPSEPESAPAKEPDPLDGHLEAVNRYVQEQALIEDVYYDYDRSELGEEARTRLHRNAEFIRRHPQFVFTLEGHCDDRGTIAYNLALGQRRASSARDYLSSLMVPGEQMRTVSYGEERPICLEADDGCWWRNRRTHFVITERR